MIVKLVLAIIGIITLVAGVLQILMPHRVWLAVEKIAVWPSGQPVPASIYVMGAVAIALGLFLLYVGIRRLAIAAWLIWLVGLLMLLAGLFMVIAPETFRDAVRLGFYARPEDTKLALSYIGGTIRIVIGLVMLVAALARPPVRVRF